MCTSTRLYVVCLCLMLCSKIALHLVDVDVKSFSQLFNASVCVISCICSLGLRGCYIFCIVIIPACLCAMSLSVSLLRVDTFVVLRAFMRVVCGGVVLQFQYVYTSTQVIVLFIPMLGTILTRYLSLDISPVIMTGKL